MLCIFFCVQVANNAKKISDAYNNSNNNNNHHHHHHHQNIPPGHIAMLLNTQCLRLLHMKNNKAPGDYASWIRITPGLFRHMGNVLKQSVFGILIKSVFSCYDDIGRKGLVLESCRFNIISYVMCCCWMKFAFHANRTETVKNDSCFFFSNTFLKSKPNSQSLSATCDFTYSPTKS